MGSETVSTLGFMFKSVGVAATRVLVAFVIGAALLASAPSGADAIAGNTNNSQTQPASYMHSQASNQWGVDGLDPGSNNFRYYSPVFAITQIDDTIYSGGKFLTVTGPDGQIDQPYLAAFSESGTQWRSQFRPDLDWSVFALESDADGNRLFVGGEFPSASGDTEFAGFAALDPSTGALDPSFGVQVARSGGSQPRVHSMHRDGQWLYIAGAFNRITDSSGTTRWTNNVARVDAQTGRHDASWRPLVSGGTVWEVVADPARDRVLLGGLFRRVNGETTAAFAMVDNETGALEDYDYGFGLQYFDQPRTNYDFVTSIAVSEDRLVIGGQQHRTLVTHPDLSVISVHHTNKYGAPNNGRGGDTQDIVIDGDIAYVACHCWGRARNTDTNELYDVRSVYALDLETGQFVTSFNPDFSGSSGPWALHVDTNHCLWLGTDATQTGQRPANGVVQLCPQDNLAWQSATAVASHPVDEKPASNLVDANSVTNHPGAASGPATNPYLDVALAGLAQIDQVVLWNTTGSAGQALADIHLWVSSKPFATDDWTELRNDPEVSEMAIPGSHGKKRTIPITVNALGQYVRVQIGSGDTLELSDISVTGHWEDNPIDPVDPAAPPTSCALAVDGDTVTVTWTGAGSNDQIIYRTANGAGPYWRGRTSAGQFVDELRAGIQHTYSVSTVGAGGHSAGVDCEPNLVGVVEPEPGPSVTITRTTRERIVLHWSPAGPMTIWRDGVQIGTDSDGWYANTGLAPGTSYEYTMVGANGASTTLVGSTQP